MLELLSLFIVIFVSSSLALFIYHNNPKSATNRTYAVFAVAIVFWAITMYLSLHPPQPGQMLFYIRASMFSAAILTTSALMLAHTFPKDKFTLKKRYFIPIVTITVITMIVAMSPYMFTDIRISGSNIEPIPGPGIALFLIPGVGYSLLSIILLIKKYLKSTGREKSQLRFVLLGLTLMLSLLIIANFVLVIVFKTSSFIFLGPLFTLTFLGSTAYAITRHRLLEIRLLVARTVAFTLLTTIIVAFFGVSLLAIPEFLPPSLHTPITILVTVTLAYSFNPLKSILQVLTENIFYKKGYSSEVLLENLSEDIRSTLAIDDITDSVFKEFHNTLHPTASAFYLINQDTKEITIKSHHFSKLPQLEIKTIKLLAKKADDSILVYQETTNKKIKKILRQNNITLVIPLKVTKTLHGILVFAEKSSGEIYNSQDLNVLEIAGPQISIAIQNSLAYDEIKRFNVTLKQKIKEATKDLRKANRDLRHLDKLKDEFVYIATHELKTPVTVMKGYMSMINHGNFGPVTKEMKEPLTEMEAANQQLVQLVNDLLEIARAESKTIKIETQPVDLIEAINLTIKNLHTLANQKHLKLEHHSQKNGKLMVMADKDRVQEILNNLVSNAIKYSDQGTITISHVVEDKKMVVTHVADQGHGISKKDQQHIFTRFFRAEEVAGKAPGTGLGLFIVKQLVEKMGGKIWFSSELGKGTTFSFSLPKAN